MIDPDVREPTRGHPEASADELRAALLRLRSYARALEERCDHLWTYVPGTHGRRDPAVPFVASTFELSDADLGAPGSRA